MNHNVKLLCWHKKSHKLTNDHLYLSLHANSLTVAQPKGVVRAVIRVDRWVWRTGICTKLNGLVPQHYTGTLHDVRCHALVFFALWVCVRTCCVMFSTSARPAHFFSPSSCGGKPWQGVFCMFLIRLSVLSLWYLIRLAPTCFLHLRV